MSGPVSGPVSGTDDAARLTEQVTSRAVPLPEEAAAGDDGDRRAEADEILRDSEERVAAAADGAAPGDAARENRASVEGV